MRASLRSWLALAALHPGLSWRPGAPSPHGCPLRAIREARRPGLRYRRPCGRSHLPRSAVSARGSSHWSRSPARRRSCGFCSDAIGRHAAAQGCGGSGRRADASHQFAQSHRFDLSHGFVTAARGARNWEGQRWDGAITVPVTTLDASSPPMACLPSSRSMSKATRQSSCRA